MDKARIQEFTEKLRDDREPGGVNAILRVLRPVLGFAVEHGYLRARPKVKMLKEP